MHSLVEATKQSLFVNAQKIVVSLQMYLGNHHSVKS